MDSLVGHIQTHSRRGEFDILYGSLEKYQEQLAKHSAAQVTQAVEALMGDVTLHTMGIIALAAYVADQAENSFVLRWTEQIVNRGDLKQLHGRRLTLIGLGTLLRRYAFVVPNGRRGLKTTTTAMSFFPSEEALTPAHSASLFLCVKFRHFGLAERILSKPVFEISPSDTGATSSDFMAYFYYGALVHIGLHHWPEALEFLETCLSVPAHSAVSTFMLEANKVYLLAGIVYRGRVPSPIAGLSSSVERILRQMTSEYMDFCSACENRDGDLIYSLLTLHEALFKNEGHWGLVQQAVQSVKKQRIIAMTRIYVTLSLAQIAAEVGETPPEVERRLRIMVANGEIAAVINRVDGTVSFQSSNAVEDDLEHKVSRVEAVMARIQRAEDTTLTSQGYLMTKLRQLPNCRELLAEFDAKRKAAAGGKGGVMDFIRGGAGGGGAAH